MLLCPTEAARAAVGNAEKGLQRGVVVQQCRTVGSMNHGAALETYLGVTDSGPRRFGRAKQH